MSETGDILSISIYHNGGGDASGILLGVYSDVSGAPSQLLGATPVTPINTTEGWQTVNLSSTCNSKCWRDNLAGMGV